MSLAAAAPGSPEWAAAASPGLQAGTHSAACLTLTLHPSPVPSLHWSVSAGGLHCWWGQVGPGWLMFIVPVLIKLPTRGRWPGRERVGSTAQSSRESWITGKLLQQSYRKVMQRQPLTTHNLPYQLYSFTLLCSSGCCSLGWGWKVAAGVQWGESVSVLRWWEKLGQVARSNQAVDSKLGTGLTYQAPGSICWDTGGEWCGGQGCHAAPTQSHLIRSVSCLSFSSTKHKTTVF